MAAIRNLNNECEAAVDGQVENFNNHLSQLIQSINADRLENAVKKGDKKEQFLYQLLEPVRLAQPMLSYHKTLERILHAALVVTGAERGFFSLRTIGNKLEYQIGRNKRNQDLKAEDFHIDRKLVLLSVHSEMVMTKSKQQQGNTGDDAVHIIAAPMYLHFDLIGILYLQGPRPLLSASHPKWKMFQLFIDHTALAIRNAQYYKVQKDAEKEKQNLENSLMQSDNLAMKGTLAAKIGHEINNYLFGIHANIEMAMEFAEEHKGNDAVLDRLEKAREIARMVTDGLGGRGIFGVEFFVKGDEVYFSELSPRPHDTGMVTLITQSQSEFALHVRAVLGLPLDFTFYGAGASGAYKALSESHDPKIEVPEHAFQANSFVRIFGKPESHPGRRMAVSLVLDNDVEEAKKRALEIVNQMSDS